MIVLGIDPGPERSSLVWFNGAQVTWIEDLTNDTTIETVLERSSDLVAVEGFVPYGVRLGHESMATIEMVGVLRYLTSGFGVVIPRPEAKRHLCHVSTAKDADVRDALLHRFGGRDAAVGKKKTPGPLYGVSGHAWAALAVAVTAFDRSNNP